MKLRYIKLRSALTLTLLFLCGIIASAQKTADGGQKWRKEFQEFKYKFLAQEMELKEEQQKRFFELYSGMESEKRKVHSEYLKARHKVRHEKNLTDADYEAATTAITEEKLKDAQIEKNYDERFKTILTPRQHFKMKEAEWKFQKKVMELRGRKCKRDKK